MTMVGQITGDATKAVTKRRRGGWCIQYGYSGIGMIYVLWRTQQDGTRSHYAIQMACNLKLVVYF